MAKRPRTIDSCDPNLTQNHNHSNVPGALSPAPTFNAVSRFHKSPSAQSEWLPLPFLVPSTNAGASHELAPTSVLSAKPTEMAAYLLTRAV